MARHSLFTRKTKSAIIIVNLCIVLGAVLLQFQYQLYEQKKQFNFTVNNVIRKDISDKFSTTKGILTSLVSYYHASHDRSPSSFANFSGDLLKNYPFLTAIGFARLVPHDERINFEESMRDYGLYDFTIKRFEPESESFVREEDQPRYAPIVRIEPSSYRLSMYYGYDLLNSPYFRDGVLKAIESSQIVTVYNFFKAVDLQTYYLLKATYAGITVPTTREERLEKVNGLYIVNIDLKTLLLPIKEQFAVGSIIVDEEQRLVGDRQTETGKKYLTQLEYLQPLDEVKKVYLQVRRPIYFNDFDLFMPYAVLASIIVLQVMVVLLWRKDLLVRRELNYQAKHDDLTGLPNRMFLRDKLKDLLEQFEVHGIGDESIAIVFIDLDHFKEVNDSYGHQFGDEVLLEVSRRFQETLRKTDTICRLGGDEFIVLLNTVGDSKVIITTIERIRECIAEPVVVESRKVYLSASFGVATFPEGGVTAGDLLKNADAAMYKAKKDGRNRYCFYSKEMTERAIERLTLESKLRQAIEDDVFKVYFQPQLDGRTNAIIGLEALVRWFDGGTFVSPEKFIPLAEDTGLIVQLDLIIMEKAIRQLGLWHKAGLMPGTLSLNLSTRQLQHPEFISHLEETLVKYDCRPEWIELEITEGHIMSDPEAAIVFLRRLAEQGIRLAVDDFGTGYSSLSYLKKLPINRLKIDRSFVRDLPDNEDDVTITTTIIALATSLNLEVIAEGVETEEQRQLLVELGCPHLQGFLYSPARPAGEIQKFLRVNPFLSDLRN